MSLGTTLLSLVQLYRRGKYLDFRHFPDILNRHVKHRVAVLSRSSFPDAYAGILLPRLELAQNILLPHYGIRYVIALLQKVIDLRVGSKVEKLEDP
jgi:hypothetical protein